MKFFTEVPCGVSAVAVSLSDRICVLGSCFADAIGGRLAQAGFSVLANPFGTLYNPASIASVAARLDAGTPFGPQDCVEIGAGDGRTGSFWHHTSFARPTAGEFLKHANARLAEACDAWTECSKVLITLGTARVWRALGRPGSPVVANCLKRPAREFSHELLSVEECTRLLCTLVETHPGKQFLFTVSPIRHLGDGAHANTLSKATLHLAVQQVLDRCGNAAYFPAYEILTDELRDYRFYAEDLVHPAPAAVQHIWERFLDACVPAAEHDRIRRNEKAHRATLHQKM